MSQLHLWTPWRGDKCTGIVNRLPHGKKMNMMVKRTRNVQAEKNVLDQKSRN
jgi:hypothetical protein